MHEQAKPTTPVVHLTLTGYLAGQTFCGLIPSEFSPGDKGAHVPYSNVDQFLRSPDVCPRCLAVWDNVEGEGEQ